jgi:hypothetical protein
LGHPCRSSASRLAQQFQATAELWQQRYGQPYILPYTAHISRASRHPAEELLAPLLRGTYRLPAEGEPGSWRAGGHAQYLLWLFMRGKAKYGRGCFADGGTILNHRALW